ncbi:unnamed protein product [Auanema sp. JU1783]|nr:unnamed protein product [Auanema sp. JU1783]
MKSTSMISRQFYAISKRLFSSRNTDTFGIVLDIDGVLQRGREVLPRVQDAFKHLTDQHNNFIVPTVFLTNGTNCLRSEKAEKLSNILELPIKPQQVLMAHSPLRMFSELHNKHVLVVGQQHARTIAENVGFTKVTTIQELRTFFPNLDCVDFSRKRISANDAIELRKNFQPIEAIILLGEPVCWESGLQLLVDCLLTRGVMADFRRGSLPDQLPVIACNVDWVWMAEGVALPRIGHGAFLHCLETFIHTLTDRYLHYHAVLGKPTEISYLHAAHVIQRQAHEMGLDSVKTLYVIGDNPMSDVLGAKLFDRYLRHGESGPPEVRTRHVVDRCISVLVETGVYKEGCRMNGVAVQPVNTLIEHLSPGEQAALQQPDFVEHNLYAAIRQILARERYRLQPEHCLL